MGGVSVTELLRGPLLCDNLPDVLGDTSCLHKTKPNLITFFLKFKLSTSITKLN